MILRQKIVNDALVTLEKHGDLFFVKIDGDVFYKSASEIFATTKFIDI